MTGFVQLISLTKKYKGLLVLAIICNLLMAVFTVISIPLIIPFFQVLFDRIPEQVEFYSDASWVASIKQGFINFIYAEGKQSALRIVCIIITALFFFKNLFRYLAKYFLAPIRNGIVRDLRLQLYQHYLALPLSFHVDSRKGDLLSRITNDVQEVDYSILNVIEAVFKSPLLIVGSIAYMLYLSPKLTLFTFILLLFTAVVIGSIAKVLRKQSAKAQSELAAINSHVEESLGGIKIAKAYNAENYLGNIFSDFNNNYNEILNKLLRRRELSSPLTEFLGVGVVVVLLYYGSILVFDNTLAPETFFAFVFAFYNVIEPSKSFSSAYYNIQKGLAAVDRIYQVIDLPIKSKSSLQKKAIKFEKSIIYENVSFKYPGTSEYVLKGINLTIKKGQTVALVGGSGGGKTTLVDLLCRFYPLTEGRITIDGTDIKELDIDALRSLFGYVSQDTLLFNDTVANNISFNTSQRNANSVAEAAKIAHAHDFIKQLEGGYNTVIGDRGVKLSGGQKQRLSLARAVIKNPNIFILDEATSALDAESEKSVQQALNGILESSTAMIIAHRLATIQNVDFIVVINDGSITEKGTHQQLMEQNGDYNNLVVMQRV